MTRPRVLFFFFAIAFLFAAAVYIQRQQPVLACQSRKIQIDDAVKAATACTKDADCALLANGCGTYVTCGKTVRADALPALQKELDAYEFHCAGLNPTMCVSCIPLQARCVDHVCIAQEVR